MPIQRYSINQHPIEALLTWIKSDEIAIPEIQRPFVWNAAKVRDFIDSLYNGYPVGYLIAWRNPDVRLKDGTQSTGKRILIDGQQRVMALFAALHGEQVVNKNYKRTRISIAFHLGEERFEVANAAIRRDRGWIADVSTVFAPDARIRQLVDDYCEANHVADKYEIDDRMERLRGIRNNSLGVIELNSDLEVETVAEINIAIGALPPEKYFSDLWEQCRNGATRYGGITEADQLQENLAAHCIPEGMDAASVEGYDTFLQGRRELMAAKIRAYYKTL